MSDEISDFRFFTHLVAAGNLSAAARVLGTSPAAMSRRLAALETRLGIRLVIRTSHSFALTEEGHVLYERALRIIADVDDAEAEAASKNVVPRGLLRVGAPTELGRRRIADLIGGFTGRYPEMRVHLALSDAGLDVVDDRLDIALRIGMPPDADAVVTRLLASRRVVCAAPAYLACHGTPRTPEDLAAHDCICLMRGLRLFNRWTYCDDGREKAVTVTPRLSTTSGEVVHDWAVAGKGIALKVLWDVEDDIRAGRLAALLTGYAWEPIDLFAVLPTRRHLSPRVRVFLDYLKSHFAGPSVSRSPLCRITRSTKSHEKAGS